MEAAQTKVFSFTHEYEQLKSEIHNRLIDTIDLSIIETLDKASLQQEIRKEIERILSGNSFNIPLNYKEREQICREVQDEVLGLGPIEPFMRDPTVTDILVNTYKQVYVERRGKLELTNAHFKDNNHLKRIIDRIVSAVGRRIDETCPMVDARLPDGSRVNAIIPPLAIDGASMSIRRFATDPLELEDLINFNTMTSEVGELIKAVVKARLNIIISGGTGSGKTTLLNVLSRFIPEDERIVTIEDSAELQLKQRHVVRLETRPPNIEGRGEITQRDLVKNSLRMRPDRIILGEVRAAEVVDMLQAMNTGHDGSMTTIHANSTQDVLSRLDSMILMSGVDLPIRSIREMIASAIDIIVHTARLSDGTRKIVQISEIAGMKDDVHIDVRDIFSFRQTGVDKQHMVLGKFHATGYIPSFVEEIKVKGFVLSEGIFKS